MSEYTPTVATFRGAYGQMFSEWRRDDALAEFDRFIARIKADALRAAQADVRASSFWADGSDNYADRVRGYLGREADRIEREEER